MFLQPDDNPRLALVSPLLDGKNYSKWRKSMQIALGAKNKLAFADGTLHRPEVDERAHSQWTRCDLMVQAWILNSCVKEVSRCIIYCESASHMWKTLQERFSQSNGPRMFELQSDIYSLHQGTMGVTEYFNKLDDMWSELVQLSHVVMCSCGGVASNENKVMKFLMGLNDVYANTRSHVLMMEPMPTMNQVKLQGSCLEYIPSFPSYRRSYIRSLRSAKQVSLHTRYQSKANLRGELLIDDSRLIDSSPKGKKQEDRIRSLPGQPLVNFTQYGGYVTVDPKTGKAFYYYFVEAQNSPNTSPLLLILNGGPGCSSLGCGAMEELGPFRVHSDGKTLYANDYAWNQAANVLFLESPAGIGFSYSNTTTDFVSGGDKQTAIDNYVFIVNWLERFQEYKGKDVYIAGESYAGHYLPQLAQTIIYQNKKRKGIIKLKGILMGNAWFDDYTGDKGMIEYWGSHALISDDLTNQIMKYCGFSPKGPEQKPCDKILEEAYETLNQIDIYNIYGSLCHDSNLTDIPKKASIYDFDPCSDYYVEAYLNNRNVQMALHANVTKISYKWEMCSSVLQNWTDSPSTVLPVLKELIKNGLRVWVVSGDADARVSVTGTQLNIKEMKLRIKDSWHPWYTQGEVGGYTQVYESNLAFATVRGAGHQVPSYKPERALTLITYFLAGKPLPMS